MKVDVTSVGSFQKQLAFVVPPDRVASQLDRAYKKLATKVKLPGFRPGKAPRKVLEAKFASQIEADVANELIQEHYRSALTDHKIQAMGQPNLADTGSVGDSAGFRFTITVDVRPEISLDKWTGLDVVFPTVEVTPEEVERAVKARLEGHAKLEEVTGREVQAGDLALVELVLKDGEEEVVREPGTMIRTAGDPYFPGVEALVLGLEIGGERQDKVTVGANARTETLAGRELDASVKVLAIQSYRVPELSDELATELAYEGGAAGMRVAIEAKIRQSRDELARNQARANLLEVIIAANPFEVPAGMTEDSLKMLMDELRMQQALRTGRDPRTIGFSESQVRDLRSRAGFAAKAALILEWVAKKEGLTVSEADFEAKYVQLAAERGQTIEAVKGWFQKEDATGELKDRILEEKTLDWMLERCTLVPPAENATPTEMNLLEGPIDALRIQLSTGAFDGKLDELGAAAAAKGRREAVTAIEARRRELARG